MNASAHAAIRAQQRGIPPLVEQWLDEFGEQSYDGHGAVIRYFSRSSLRQLARAFGSGAVSKLSAFLNAYKVHGLRDGRVVTMGHRTRRILRR